MTTTTNVEPPAPHVEGWLGQIWLDDKWQDYARGYEHETKAWQRLDVENRRIVHWISRGILVDAQRKIRLWAVSATRSYKTTDNWVSTRELPMFYLDPSVQGILDAAGAETIAREILGDVDPWVTFNVHIEPLY